MVWNSEAESALVSLVSQYGTRWGVISTHLQSMLGHHCSSLECSAHWRSYRQRLNEVEARPLVVMPTEIRPDSHCAMVISPTSPTKIPFSERARACLDPATCPTIMHAPSPASPALPPDLLAGSPNTKISSAPAKRWREPDAPAPKPTRLHPCSPPTVQLITPGCPSYLLAPGSSVGASEKLRRQLKAVYLAMKLKNATLEGSGGGAELCAGEETHSVLTLLSRELSRLKSGVSENDLIPPIFRDDAAVPTGGTCGGGGGGGGKEGRLPYFGVPPGGPCAHTLSTGGLVADQSAALARPTASPAKRRQRVMPPASPLVPSLS